VLAALDGAGGLFFRMLSDRVASLLAAQDQPPPTDQALAAAMWDLVWAGHLTNDTLAPLRTVLAAGGAGTAPSRGREGPARGGADAAASRGQVTSAAGALGGPVPGLGRAPAGRGGGRRGRYGRPMMPTRTGPPTVSGRWSLLPGREPDPTRRLHAIAQTMLDRHGILTRGAVTAERLPGGFGALYPVLRAMEEAGQCRRGYFVEGLGAAQFALPGAVDRMRAMASEMTGLAPQDPARELPVPKVAAEIPMADAAAVTAPAGAGAFRGAAMARAGEGARASGGAPGTTGGAPGTIEAPGPGTPGGGTPGGGAPGGGAAGGGTAGGEEPGGWRPGGGRGTVAMPEVGPPSWARGGAMPAGVAPKGADGPVEAVVLAAADPASAFGSALPWPERPGEVPGAHRPGRKAGALVVLCRGKLVLYVERGGKTLLSWTSDPAVLGPAAAALAAAVRGGALGRLTVERADGSAVYDTPLAQALADAGFRPTPRGLRLRR
jgi:ATP-dependent Lhr-like helicase